MSWAPASSLSEGDLIFNIENKRTYVRKVQNSGMERSAYNIEVDNYHSYFVGLNGALVHNTSKLDESFDNPWKQTTLGQEITIVPDNYENPLYISRKIKGWINNGNITEVSKNKKAKVKTDIGEFIIEHDGNLPGQAPIVEIATPPFDAYNEPFFYKLLDQIHSIAPPIASVGGGHIHIDGKFFLQNPSFLGTFLQHYITIEPAILNKFRHPARNHAARGFFETLNIRVFRLEIDKLSTTPPDTLSDRLNALFSKFNIQRESALNLRSLAGVYSGNKKSKGTIEMRLFDSPENAKKAAEQRNFLRLLLRTTFEGDSSLFRTESFILDYEDAVQLLKRSLQQEI
jgi:hypothetical protein